MKEHQTLEHFFANAWRRLCGLDERIPRDRRPDMESLQLSQWNQEFETLMRNRLVMGAFRYGTFEEQAANIRHDNPESIRKHLELYIVTGNAEHLVDIANLALVEFTAPSHENFHFQAVDDGHHARRVSE